MRGTILTFCAGRPAYIPGSNANVTIARTFTTAGSLWYSCTIHPGMNGVVVVQ
jgi:plastocyanin